MDIGNLRAIQLLRQGGKLEILNKLGAAVQLAMEHHIATESGDWGEFPNKVKSLGPVAAREVWDFLDGLPALVNATGHFHFARPRCFGEIGTR